MSLSLYFEDLYVTLTGDESFLPKRGFALLPIGLKTNGPFSKLSSSCA